MGDSEHSSGKKSDEDMKIFCVDLSALPRTVQFLLLCSAVFFFFLIYAYMQELFFRLEEVRSYGLYLTLVQFGCYAGFGFVEMSVSSDRSRKIPLKMYFFLAFLSVATMGLSNAAIGYLNYPTQVIFKSCKLIPVMLGGVLIQGKKYSAIDVVALLMMIVGLIWFTLADNSVSPSFNTYGVFLISLALCFDGVIGNYQEKTMKHYGAGTSEMVFYSFAIGFVYILVGVVLYGDLISVFQVCQKHPMETYGYAVVFSLFGYLGVYIVFTLLKSFGALVAVTVTTCRKGMTVVLSFFFFTKPFTYQYVWSGLIVILGIYLNVYSKNKASWDSQISRWWLNIQQRLGIGHTDKIKSIASTIV